MSLVDVPDAAYLQCQLCRTTLLRSRSRLLPMTIQSNSTVTAEISIRTHLWAQWAAIALEQAELAREGRQRIEAQVAAGAPGYDMPLELKPAMISIAAVTHAIEGFLNDFLDACADFPRPHFADDTPQYAKVFETLRAGFTIQQHADWYPALKNVYQVLRNPAVHHVPKSGATVPHPVFPTNVSPEYAAYTVESARGAVELLADVLTTCVENPRPELKSVGAWSGQVHGLATGIAAQARSSQDT